MRNLQLEYGAEIGRAVVNFAGPIVFYVVSRDHGGAFVVFSKALNSSMTVLAVEGSYASVIGGAPAAAVVFAGVVDARTAAEPRVRELESRLRLTDGVERATLAAQLDELQPRLIAALQDPSVHRDAVSWQGVTIWSKSEASPTVQFVPSSDSRDLGPWRAARGASSLAPCHRSPQLVPGPRSGPRYLWPAG